MNRCFLSIILGLVLLSCSEDDFSERKSGAGKRMEFSIGVSELQQVDTRGGSDLIETIEMKGENRSLYVRSVTSPGIDRIKEDTATRATAMTTTNFHPSYGLLMYQYDKTDTWASVGSTTTPEIYNEEVLRSRGWMTNEFWPGVDYKVSFYGYAPYNDPNITNMSSATDAGVPWLSYEVPDDANDQNDLLISWGANDVAGNYDELVSNVYGLHFRHVCTAIRFAVGDQMAPCTIKRIELQNIYGAGDYTFGDASWTLTGNPDRTFYLEQDLVIKKNDQNKILTTGNNLFMMLPQTTPSDAMLVITVDDGEEHEMAAKLDNKVWRMGTTVTYYLSTAEVNGRYILNVTQPDDVSAAGGEISYNVTSYYLSYYGTAVPVPWRAKYKVGGIEYEKPGELMPTFKNAGDGATTAVTYKAKVGQQTPRSTTANSHTAALRSRSVVGSSSNYKDLSNGGETANCYVVNAPGYYKIPLVYGNARNNPDVYNVNNFVDHLNAKITVENIYDKYVPMSAKMIWQDAPHLITPTSLKLSPDGEYLMFQIERENICQGNAVIGINDFNYRTMWSWHIWVTDADVSTSNTIEVVNADNVSSHFMSKTLGFCDADYRESPARTFQLIFEQQDPLGETASVSIKQDSIILDMKENAPFYQWGRKDPFPGCYREGDPNDITVVALDKPCYDVDGHWIGGTTGYEYYDFGFSKTKPNVSMGIQYPNIIFDSDNKNWCSVNALTFWNVAATTAYRGYNNYEIVKSMYDPCPPGFKMPRAGAFSGMGYTSYSTVLFADASDLSSDLPAFVGYNGTMATFKTGVGNNTIDLYMCGGCRGEKYTKGNAYFGYNGYYWTGGTGSSDVGGTDFGFGIPGSWIESAHPERYSQYWVTSSHNEARHWAMSVLPDRE